jgi:hypothetical protein
MGPILFQSEIPGVWTLFADHVLFYFILPFCALVSSNCHCFLSVSGQGLEKHPANRGTAAVAAPSWR